MHILTQKSRCFLAQCIENIFHLSNGLTDVMKCNLKNKILTMKNYYVVQKNMPKIMESIFTCWHLLALLFFSLDKYKINWLFLHIF